MVPINLEQFKGLIEINGEKLIERLITQLQEAGISDITVVAGFQKEEYDYLVDRFGVNMKIVQSYNEKNNLDYLFSKEKISNTYILSSDLYFVSWNIWNSILFTIL